MKNNELTTNNSTFLKLKDFDLSIALSDELAGLTGSFERIKIPAAGSTVFEIPSEDPNNPEAVKEFSAVILYVSSQVKCTLFRQQMHTFSAPVF